MKNLKVIISGGGTGGHIFPAISIANGIKKKYPQAEILFIGAEDRMEMQRVPASGYKIVGLPVAGFERKKIWKNFGVLLKLNKSMRIARKTIQDFGPNIVIGVGGYASGPTLKAANQLNIPTLLQEQNSHAGVTNKLLASKAARICVAYEGMESFFPKENITLTGNPIRQDLIISEEKRKEGYEHFNLDPKKKTILILGGSLGAHTINKSVTNNLGKITREKDIQFLWQSGKHYYQYCLFEMDRYSDSDVPIILTEFISRMDLAYSIADLIVSRAGAGSISEFSILGKPVILVPSPNVAEDHQTKNAMALVRKNAAILVSDKGAENTLIPAALELIRNENKLQELSGNILKMALPDAAEKIVHEIEKILNVK